MTPSNLPQILPLGEAKHSLNDSYSMSSVVKISSLDVLISEIAALIKNKQKSDIYDPIGLLEVLSEIRENSYPDQFNEDIISAIKYWREGGDISHSVISGPNSSDKVKIGKFLARIWRSLGKITPGNIKITTRENLLGSYLQPPKSRILEESNHIVVIDEAYTLQDV